MKATLSVLVLLSSFSALAQIRADECPRPGLIQSKMAGQTGEEVAMSHDRIGTVDIPETFSQKGLLRTRIFNNFVDRVCVAKPYVTQENVCEPVSPDLALGRGNAFLKGLYNLGETSLRRADMMMQNLKFSEGFPSGERLELAMQILSQLTRLAATTGVPTSFEALTASLNQAMSEGYLPFQLVDEFTNIYREHNRRVLGFTPLEGSRIIQGTGNGRLNTVFDLGLSREARAQRISSLIVGVNPKEAMGLSASFINFASMNGIPTNWDQFSMMMRDAVSTQVISERAYQAVLVDYELANRAALGFELSAEVCRMTEMRRQVNVVEVVNRQELVKTVNQAYEINFMSAPLLQGERESMTLTTNGLRALDLRISSNFNRYQVKGVEEGGTMKFVVVGTRLAVRPPNGLKVKFSRTGVVNLVRIINQGFNPKAGGKVLVKVRYINGKAFNDKTLATETYELNGSTELVQTAALQHKEVDFVKVSIQIAGSPYYGAEFSEEVKAKDKD